MGKKRYNGEICPIKDCGEFQRDIGFCQKHAQRFRRHGDPNFIIPENVRVKNNRNAQPHLRVLKDTTYPKLFGRHEHRVVAEKMIGRKLKRGEIVHHLDGNKHNNHPSNLEVTTQSEHIEKHRQEMNKKRWGKC